MVPSSDCQYCGKVYKKPQNKEHSKLKTMHSARCYNKHNVAFVFKNLGKLMREVLHYQRDAPGLYTHIERCPSGNWCVKMSDATVWVDNYRSLSGKASL